MLPGLYVGRGFVVTITVVAVTNVVVVKFEAEDIVVSVVGWVVLIVVDSEVVFPLFGWCCCRQQAKLPEQVK
jgi:hypothetical protein